MQIEVTQFIPPRGRQEQVHTEVADDCAVGYEAMRRHACRLTAERLMTGAISVCIEHEEGDYDIQIIWNGPEVQQALEKMLRAFDGAKFERWLRAINEPDAGEDADAEAEAF